MCVCDVCVECAVSDGNSEAGAVVEGDNKSKGNDDGKGNTRSAFYFY